MSDILKKLDAPIELSLEFQGAKYKLVFGKDKDEGKDTPVVVIPRNDFLEKLANEDNAISSFDRMTKQPTVFYLNLMGKEYKISFNDEGKVTPHNDVIERLMNNESFWRFHFEQPSIRIAKAMQVLLRNYEEKGFSWYMRDEATE